MQAAGLSVDQIDHFVGWAGRDPRIGQTYARLTDAAIAPAVAALSLDNDCAEPLVMRDRLLGGARLVPPAPGDNLIDSLIDHVEARTPTAQTFLPALNGILFDPGAAQHQAARVNNTHMTRIARAYARYAPGSAPAPPLPAVTDQQRRDGTRRRERRLLLGTDSGSDDEPGTARHPTPSPRASRSS